MKKAAIGAMCLMLLALCACGAEPAGSTAAPTSAPQTEQTEPVTETQAPSETETHLQPEDGWEVITIQGVEMLWDGYRVKEPEVDLDIDAMNFADFGKDSLTEVYPVETEVYTLCAGEIMETEVLHIKGQEEGKTVYIVAGVHGDEIAAWYAGRLLRNATLKAGELYIIAPANANGAKNRTRYVTGNQDMNRSFPGSEDGNEAERIAHAIYEDIARVKPFLVLDLHEAILYTEGRDFLGSSLIFSRLGEASDLYFDMIFATQDGLLCSNEFGTNGPGPAGSINRTVSDELEIPAITVETFRGFPIERRVHDQLDIVEYVLNYLTMR